jgi:hypothetical protein
MDGKDGGRVERNEVGREGSHREKRELPLVDRAVEGCLKCNKHAPYPEFVQDPGEIHLFPRRSIFNVQQSMDVMDYKFHTFSVSIVGSLVDELVWPSLGRACMYPITDTHHAPSSCGMGPDG